MLLVVAATAGELRGLDPERAEAEPLACGIGPVDAAAATAARLTAGPAPHALLHVGIAGARRTSDIPLGSVILGDASIYCDTASSLVVSELPPDPQLLRRASMALPHALVRRIGTSADVAGSHGCDVEAMEGFGVLRAAKLAGVPALELRVVSNEVEEEDRALWQFDSALDTLAELLPQLAAALV